MTAANSSPSNERVRGSVDLRRNDRLIWTQPDGAKVFVIVKGVNRASGVAYLRCHIGAKAWTRRHELPLYPSMRLAHWTTADLLDQP